MEDSPATIYTKSATATKGPAKRGARGNKGRQNVAVSTTSRPTTLAERAAQVSAAVGAPATSLPVTPIPLQQLSNIMDSFFPVEAEPQSYISSVMVDTHAGAYVASETYRHVTRVEPKLEEQMSEAEFVLAFGYTIAHRVLRVREHVVPQNIVGMPEFTSRMQTLTKLPEPMAQYLEGIGLHRDASGQTLCPEIVLPRHDFNDHRCGMMPSRVEDGYANNNEWNANSAMFPFGLLERRIVSDSVGQPLAGGPNLFIQLDPAIPNAADDAHLVTSSAAVGRFDYLAAHARRVPQMTRGYYARNQPDILNSIRWDSPLFVTFLSFIQRMEKFISCVPYGKSTAGSPAMMCAAVPLNGTNVLLPTNFDFNSFGALSNSEMHAARLFQYRVLRTVAPHTSEALNADAAFTYNAAPANLTGNAPMRLTTLRGYDLYMAHYIRHFLKIKI